MSLKLKIMNFSGQTAKCPMDNIFHISNTIFFFFYFSVFFGIFQELHGLMVFLKAIGHF